MAVKNKHYLELEHAFVLLFILKPICFARSFFENKRNSGFLIDSSTYMVKMLYRETFLPVLLKKDKSYKLPLTQVQ